MGAVTRVNLPMEKKTELAGRYGQMALCSSGNGRATRSMDLASSSGLIREAMKANS